MESPCENNAAECFENVNGEAQCECPTCENQLDPVCGYMISTSEGFTEETYKSACHLQKLTCEEELQDFEVMHKGPCGGMFYVHVFILLYCFVQCRSIFLTSPQVYCPLQNWLG